MTVRRNIPAYIRKIVAKTFNSNDEIVACYGVFRNGRRWAAKRVGEFEAKIVANHPKGGIYESWLVL